MREQGAAWPEEPRPTPALSCTDDKDDKPEPGARGAPTRGSGRKCGPPGAGKRGKTGSPERAAYQKRRSQRRGRKRRDLVPDAAAPPSVTSAPAPAAPSPQPRRLSPRRRLLPGPATCLPCSRRWLLFQHGSGRSGIAWARTCSGLGTQQGESRSRLTHLSWSPGLALPECPERWQAPRRLRRWLGEVLSTTPASSDGGGGGRRCPSGMGEARGAAGAASDYSPWFGLSLVQHLDLWTSVANIWAGLA